MQIHLGKKSPKAFASIPVRSSSSSNQELTKPTSIHESRNSRVKPVKADASLHRNMILGNMMYPKSEENLQITDDTKHISTAETPNHYQILNQVLPLSSINFRDEAETFGYGLLKTAESPKLSKKLQHNLTRSMDLSKSIVYGSQKAIVDSIIKADGKDLQTELQLGELTLCNLDKKLSKCLEHSRRTLSLTETYSQKASTVLTPEKKSLFMDSSIPSPARKNSNDSAFGNRKLSHSNSSSLSFAKKASDVSMRSLAMTRETTGEEIFVPSLEVKDSTIKVRSFDLKPRDEKTVPIKEFTKPDVSSPIFASNIVPRNKTKTDYINTEQSFSKNKVSSNKQYTIDEIKNLNAQSLNASNEQLVIKNRLVKENPVGALPPSPELLNRSLDEVQHEPFISSASDVDPSKKSGVKKALLQNLKSEMKKSTSEFIKDTPVVKDENTLIESSLNLTNELNGVSLTENILFNQSFEQNRKSSPLLLLKTTFLSQSKSQDGLDYSLSKSQDIDAQFTKAFSLVKNKAMHQGTNFDERMKSDIYFRKRFDDDLLEFKKMIQPKISEEKATELYSKLVEDGKKRALKSQQIEKQKEIVRQERAKDFYDYLSLQTDDQHQKVFERLVGDSKERAKEKERREIERQDKLEKEEDEIMNLSNHRNKRMNKKSVQNLVDKLVQDAERRKHSAEKAELLKSEEENKSLIIVRQKSPEKNKQVESKVKQYINRAIERNVQVRQRSVKKYENIPPPTTTEKIPFKKMRCNTEQNFVKTIPPTPQKSVQEEPQTLKKPTTSSKEFNEIKQTCMKEAWKANLEYLRGLRVDIEKIKDNIEQKIEDIERGNFVFPEEQPQKPPLTQEKSQQTREQTLKLSQSQNHSLERAPENVKSKTRNQSITSDHATKKRQMQNQRRMPRATSVSSNFFKEEDSAGKSMFMTNQKAESYVTQLINDFREIHHIKPHLRR